jgi:hypothetical protein
LNVILLGMRTKEGDHPDTRYYAAELPVAIKQANQAAKTAGNPVYFKL